MSKVERSVRVGVMHILSHGDHGERTGPVTTQIAERHETKDTTTTITCTAGGCGKQFLVDVYSDYATMRRRKRFGTVAAASFLLGVLVFGFALTEDDATVFAVSVCSSLFLVIMAGLLGLNALFYRGLSGPWSEAGRRDPKHCLS